MLDCYIPGSARQKTWREILLCVERIDHRFPSQIWAARVPSESNVADAPSRGTIGAHQFSWRDVGGSHFMSHDREEARKLFGLKRTGVPDVAFMLSRELRNDLKQMCL